MNTRSQKQKSIASRRQFLKQTMLITGTLLLDPFESQAIKSVPSVTDPRLKAVVIGDSVMWGQGLRGRQKFSNNAVEEIGRLLGREARIEIDLSHSGAPINAASESCDLKCKRKKFVDTYPTLFGAKLSTTGMSEAEAAFVNDNDQSKSVLYGEIPSTFPTINSQLDQVPQNIANEAELLILNGGANDLDFEELLNPEEHQANFVKHYDPLLKEYTYSRVKSLLRQARDKFPKAVILFTGYFSPFYPGRSSASLRNLFEHMSGQDRWKVWTNKRIIELKNIDQLVLEAQHRSLFSLARGLHWTRKAVAESNNDPRLKGPGILFIHPQFGPENAVFEPNSFFHPYYKLSQIRDPAKEHRENNIIRKGFQSMMENLAKDLILVVPFANNNFFTADDITVPIAIKRKASLLLSRLDGPGRLIKALRPLTENRASFDELLEGRNALVEDIQRINRAKMGSFLHPSEKGAARYTGVIVKRYNERLKNVNLNNDIVKFANVEGISETQKVTKIFQRYGLSEFNISPENASQLMLIDSIALEVETSTDSEKNMFDDIYLNLGNNNKWKLNFPYRYISKVPFKILHEQFKPGTHDLFTIDGMGMHLSSISQFTIERKKAINEDNNLIGKGGWRPSKVTLYLNGIQVFSVPFFSVLDRNDELQFPYPKK